MKILSKLLFIIVLFTTSCKKNIDTIATTATLKRAPEVCIINLDPGKINSSYMKKPQKPLPLLAPEPITITTDTSYSVMLLDFNGQTISSSVWNNGQTFICAPSGLDPVQIDGIINEVRTDYLRYKVIITTDENLYLQAHSNKRMRAVITPTSSWYAGVGGVSYTGSLDWGDNTPCFVFIDRLGYNAHNVAEICSHELGHTAGLSHQSSYSATCVLSATYNTGDGTNAPLMGNSMNAYNGGSWWIGPTPVGCSAYQDDNKILTAKLLLR